MNHIARIQEKLPEYGLDAMLVVSDPGERYALDFHGEGLLLVTPSHALYITDGRYIEAAGEQLPDVDIRLDTRISTKEDQAAGFIEAEGIRRLGFESGAVSVDTFQKYGQNFPCELVPAQSLLDGLRVSKDEEEIARMRKAQEITDETFTAICRFINAGMTEKQIAARLVYEMMSRGAERTSFDPIVATGPNGSRPHAVPTDRMVHWGEFITMDFGCVYQGYCSDMTRTVCMGPVTAEMKVAYRAVLEAQEAGIAAARAGVSGQDIDTAARTVLEKAGLGQYFAHSFGHSLGIEIHENPRAAQGSMEPLPAGTVISAEPGVYIPGQYGIRIEDVLVIREDGCEDITHSRKDLTVL